MINQASKFTGIVIFTIMAVLMMAPLPVAAGEHREEAENAASEHQIHPVPGDKACLHHIAQYDEEGNFVGYKTERGPCR